MRGHITMYFFLMILSGFWNTVLGQKDCRNSLYEAHKLYETGQIQGCIKILEDCLQSNKDKEERIETAHLLALAYQTLNNTERSDYFVKVLLSLDHEYQNHPNIDPVEFRRVVNSYQVLPSLLLGLKAGVNYSSVQLNKSYSVFLAQQSYLPVMGYQFGVSGIYNLIHGLDVRSDFLFSGYGINHLIKNAGGWDQNFQEQQSYGVINLYLDKTWRIGKGFGIIAGAGPGISYLTASNVFLESTNVQTGSRQQSTVDPVASRNRIQYSANLVLGLKKEISKGTLFIETGLNYYFLNTVKSENRMNDLDFIFNNHYVYDDINLIPAFVNIGYTYPLIWKIRKTETKKP